MKLLGRHILALVFLGVLFPLGAHAYNPSKEPVKNELPKEVEGVGITEKLGEKVDLSLKFQDQNGQTVTMADYLNKKVPVIFTIIYYNCPSLCNYHLNGLTDALKQMKLTAGKDFQLVALSMNHKETPQLAKDKLNSYLKDYGRGSEGWHFLVGSERNVKAMADSVGFRFKWNPKIKEYAHASAAQIITPDGKISGYLHGVQFAAKTLKYSLVAASNGKIGNILDQFVLYCFNFDPNKNTVSLRAYNAMRVGGALFVLLLAGFLVPLWIREKRKSDRLS